MDVDEDVTKDLVRDGSYDKFIKCVRGIGIQKLGLDRWNPEDNNDEQELKELVTRVFQSCPKVIEIAVGVKIIEDDDPSFVTNEKKYNESESVYYEVTRK